LVSTPKGKSAVKIEWQADDIQAGRRIGHPENNEQWMIGYLASTKSDEPRWVLIRLADGMINDPPLGKTDLAKNLNASKFLPLELLPSGMSARGSKGGKARASSLTPQRRSEIAAAAGNARWGNGS
jgi:hypothetical protein